MNRLRGEEFERTTKESKVVKTSRNNEGLAVCGCLVESNIIGSSWIINKMVGENNIGERERRGVGWKRIVYENIVEELYIYENNNYLVGW